jgi:ribosome-associated protein
MTDSTAAKKDTQRLQRAIVEGLEDVKGQEIQVFNTEHLSPLFERVIIASGTSNRQTKALAASVRDAVREAGFAKPRIEGEENGEWIIVDCGAAVAHIMQPAIRGYYLLEEIWGDKPVRLKLGAPKPAAPAPARAESTSSKKKAPLPNLRRSSAALKGQRAADEAAKEGKPARKSATKSAAKSAARPAAKAAGKSGLTKAATKPATRPATPSATGTSAASRLAAGKAAPAKKATAAPAAKKAAPAAKKAAPAVKRAAPAAKKAAPAAKKPR